MSRLAAPDRKPVSGGARGRAAPLRRYVLFTVGGVEYAVDARHVRRALAVREDRGPAVRLGDTCYPVRDLRRLFRTGGAGGPGALLLVAAGGEHAALGIDAVGTLLPIADQAVVPLPAVYQGAERAWLGGVVALGGRLVVTVRPEGILRDVDLARAPAREPAVGGSEA